MPWPGSEPTSNQGREEATRIFRAEMEATGGVEIRFVQDTMALAHANGIGSEGEHFGFADPISQPPIEGADVPWYPGDGVLEPDGRWRPSRPGEFLLGYEDEVGPDGTQAPEPFELRVNGTYMVFRKLYQDVAAFRRYLATAAKSLYGSDDQYHQDLVAAKMMGRWRSGCPVDLSPNKDDLAIAADPERRNNFTYDGDDQGLRCPIGSHLRRSNPRATPLKRATAVRRHRLIRRGVEYGPHLEDGALEDDGVDRGLINLFIQADIERQFEFVQHEWMKGGEFLGLDPNEQDPINGVGGEGSQMSGAGRQATVPVRSAYLRQSEGWRISVRAWAESARGLDRAEILNAKEVITMSDHFSGPAVMGDPAVDITDFYAFPSPERPENLVLIMDVFPLATPQSFFSDTLTHRFRLRPLTRSRGQFAHGTAEHTIDVNFSDVPDGTSVQKGNVVTSDGRNASFIVGEPLEQDGMRVFAGLVSDPFFMDVEAAQRTDHVGTLSFSKQGTNSVEFRDVLSIVVEVPIAPIVDRFEWHHTDRCRFGELRHAPRQADPDRTSRTAGDQELHPARGDVTIRVAKGVELRDLYNREDAFALSKEYRPLYESRLDANLAFFDGLDGKTAWPLGPDGRHPLRDLLMNDFLILDLAHAFAPGSFLEIERAMLDDRPHESAGGRWLDDDILDEMLTLMVNGGRGERLGDGVDAPTKPASLSFPYVREPNKRADLPLPAFLRS